MAFCAALWLSGLVLVPGASGAALTATALSREALLPRYNSACTTISPPPTNETCGVKGYVKRPEGVFFSPPFAGNSSVSQSSSCSDLCFGRSKSDGCIAFAYKASTGLCVLYSVSLDDQQFQSNDSSPFQFYSQNCFRCPKQCPHPPNVNIADNGGFEFSNQLFGPWLAQLGHPTVTSPGSNSDHALKAADSLTLLQSHDICDDQEYTFSVDIMVTNPPSGKANKPIHVFLTAGQLEIYIPYFLNHTSGRAGAGFGTWRTFQGTTKGRTTSNEGLLPTEFSVGFGNFEFEGKYHIYEGYTIYIDNFIVKPTSDTYQTVGRNLLENGGFESGALSPWVTSNFGYDDASPYSNEVVSSGLTAGSSYSYLYHAEEYQHGPYGKHCNPSGKKCTYFRDYHYGSDLGGVEIQQDFDAVIGQLYLLTFVYRAQNVNQIEISVEAAGKGPTSLRWNVLNDGTSFPEAYFGSQKYDYYPISVDKVVKFSRVFEAQAPKNLLVLTFAGFGFYDQEVNNIQIDDVSILALAPGQRI